MCLATARGYNELTSVNGTNYCIAASGPPFFSVCLTCVLT